MHNISHKGFSWMATLAIGALVFFTLSFSFVRAEDDSTTDTSSTDTSSTNSDYSIDTSGNYSGGSVTGTYVQDGITSDIVSTGCSNSGTSCDSVQYDNGLTIYDYNTDLNSGVTSGLIYVDGQYVYAEVIDNGDGTETWQYSAPVESGDGGAGNNTNDQNTDNTNAGTTNNTTNTTNTTPQVSCSFSFACFPPPTTTTTTTSSPCFTALCTGEPTNTTNGNPNNNPPNIPQQPATPTAIIDASPRLVRTAESTQLTWSSTGARSCAVIYAGNTIFTGTSGSQTLSNISGTRLYKLDCVNAGGVHAVASVTVSAIPAWREI